MNIPIVLSTVGNLVLMLAGIILVPLGVAFYYEDDSAIWAFIYTIIITGVLGGLSKAFFRKKMCLSISGKVSPLSPLAGLYVSF